VTYGDIRRDYGERVHEREAPHVKSDNLINIARCEIGCQLVLSTNRKLHSLWAFVWHQNQWPWMVMNGVMIVDARYLYGSW